jgi:xanthine/uracil/vitamin C permease (AzgA family)
MSFFGLGPSNDVLQRADTLSLDAPGKIRWVSNKGADQSGHVNTENIDGTGKWQIRAYNIAGTLTQYAVYHLTFDGDEETNPKVLDWTNAGNNNRRRLVVAPEAYPDATWQWFDFAGTTIALVEGTTDVAKDDYLMLDTDAASGVDSLITSGGAVETDSTVAIACEASTAASKNATRVYLIGDAKICDTQ